MRVPRTAFAQAAELPALCRAEGFCSLPPATAEAHVCLFAARMKHIAAYLLLLVGGNAAPTADDIKKVLSAGGVEADDEALTRLMTAVDGKVR